MKENLRPIGFARLSNCYHESASCPVLKHVMGCGHSILQEYTNEAAAIAAGHKRRCRLCLGDKVFIINGPKDRVYISDEQNAVLKCVVDLYSKSGAMTLRQISAVRNKSVVSTYLIIKRLRADGLVEHKLKIGGLRASGRSIVPTKRGVLVAKSEALPDLQTP